MAAVPDCIKSKQAELLIALVERNPHMLNHDALIGLRDDKQFMTAAVTMNGVALAYDSELLRDDTDVVIAATKHSGIVALQYASACLKHDPKENVVTRLSTLIRQTH